jgi:4'-phosphopantetheinyl transferase EntD
MYNYIITTPNHIPANLLNSKEFANHDRALEFTLSRLSLLKCLEQFGVISTFENLEIIGHKNLKSHPDFLVSLAHTKNVGLGILAPNEEFKSIGIDIEACDRPIKDDSQKFFKNSEDDEIPLLNLWVTKESAFKAIEPIKEQFSFKKEVLTLKDIWVKENQFGLSNSDTPIGNLELILKKIGDKDYLISIATI